VGFGTIIGSITQGKDEEKGKERNYLAVIVLRLHIMQIMTFHVYLHSEN
jgi:hypothetical protein